MKLEQAQKIAESLKRKLEPYCERIEIGGSIRRKKPEVKRIISEFDNLVARLNTVKHETVLISDMLIGAQATDGGLDDSPKPMPPEYFTIKCFNLLNDFRGEVEQLETMNARLLRHIHEVEKCVKT